jgi:hypothetical protein
MEVDTRVVTEVVAGVVAEVVDTYYIIKCKDRQVVTDVELKVSEESQTIIEFLEGKQNFGKLLFTTRRFGSSTIAFQTVVKLVSVKDLSIERLYESVKDTFVDALVFMNEPDKSAFTLYFDSIDAKDEALIYGRRRRISPEKDWLLASYVILLTYLYREVEYEDFAKDIDCLLTTFKMFYLDKYEDYFCRILNSILTLENLSKRCAANICKYTWDECVEPDQKSKLVYELCTIKNPDGSCENTYPYRATFLMDDNKEVEKFFSSKYSTGDTPLRGLTFENLVIMTGNISGKRPLWMNQSKAHLLKENVSSQELDIMLHFSFSSLERFFKSYVTYTKYADGRSRLPKGKSLGQLWTHDVLSNISDMRVTRKERIYIPRRFLEDDRVDICHGMRLFGLFLPSSGAIINSSGGIDRYEKNLSDLF